MFAHRLVFAACLVAAAYITWSGIVPAHAAELIMFERDGCPYCAQFNREIAPIYPRTPVGRQAPLRHVDIYKPIPLDLQFVRVERITPVFVLIDQGREVGRIRGYPGEANFWGLVENLVGTISPRNGGIHANPRLGRLHLASNPDEATKQQQMR